MIQASQSIILANLDKSSADIVAMIAAQPPVAKSSSPASTYITYVSIGALLGDLNVAGKVRTGLEAWLAAPDLSLLNPALPNIGTLQSLHDRLASYPGVDMADPNAPALMGLFASGVDAAHPPLISTVQRDTLLSVGYTLPEVVTTADVDAFKAANALDTARQTVISADAATWNSRVASVQAVTTLEQLQSIGTLAVIGATN